MIGKVLVVTSTFPYCSDDVSPTFVNDLCLGLSKNYNIEVVAPSFRGRPSLDPRVKPYRYFFGSLERLTGGSGIVGNLKTSPIMWLLLPFFFSAQIFAIWRKLLPGDVEIIHAHWIFPQGLCVLIARFFSASKPKIILTSHGGDLYTFNSKLLVSLKKKILQSVELVAVVSASMRDYCTARMDCRSERVVVAPMGVDLKERFVPGGARHARELLFVGRLVEKKGVDVLIAALNEVRKSEPNVHLTIIGSGYCKDALVALVDDFKLVDNVTFLGSVPNEKLAVYYQSCRLVVLPFRVAKNGDQEGLGLTTVEAMGCETPVLATFVPALSDVIIDGVNGRLIVPDDKIGLASEILSLLRDDALCKKLGVSGRSHALAHFDWSAVVARYGSLYDRLLVQSKTPS